MNLYEKIVAGEEKISLVGLGYVGMPIAVAFARKVKVVGFDLNEEKINLYIKKSINYEMLLKNIYKYLSIQYNVPIIEWLES